MARLKDFYKDEVAPALMKKFEYKSPMQIPEIKKIVINVACGDAKDNSKIIDAVSNDLGIITGQKPVVCKARKSVEETILSVSKNSSYSPKSNMTRSIKSEAWILCS